MLYMFDTVSVFVVMFTMLLTPPPPPNKTRKTTLQLIVNTVWHRSFEIAVKHIQCLPPQLKLGQIDFLR